MKMKYVSSVNKKQIKKLQDIMRNNSSFRVRTRAHAILLSARGFSIDDIVNIYQIHRDTVSSWIDLWEQSGLKSLADNPRSGRPAILTEDEQKIAIQLLKKYPRSVKKVIEKLAEETGKSVSRWTIKRLALSADLKWKRIRKSLKSKRDEKKFEQAKQEIQELKQKQQKGEIDLYYFDEAGFDLIPTIPYAWQPKGKNTGITSSKSSRLNVLGFLNTSNNNFHSFTFQSSIDSEVVVECFNRFSKTIKKKTVVVIDNSPAHTSEFFIENIEKWEARKLFIQNIPPYSPELNLIEILWRFIKYLWLPFSAYLSFKDLVREVEYILANIGSKYRINFA